MPVVKKKCPICGKKDVSQNAGGITNCPDCGHGFRPSD